MQASPWMRVQAGPFLKWSEGPGRREARGAAVPLPHRRPTGGLGLQLAAGCPSRRCSGMSGD